MPNAQAVFNNKCPQYVHSNRQSIIGDDSKKKHSHTMLQATSVLTVLTRLSDDLK